MARSNQIHAGWEREAYAVVWTTITANQKAITRREQVDTSGCQAGHVMAFPKIIQRSPFSPSNGQREVDCKKGPFRSVQNVTWKEYF